MVDLGQTLDYRHWLRSLYEERKAQDAFFSWRYLAGRLGVDASYLVRVAQGHRHLAEEALERLAAFAGLDGRDLEIFRALAAFNRARGEREQRACYRRLQELRSPGASPLPDDHVEFFRRWFPVVVRTLGGLPGFVDDPAWVADRLDPPIAPEEAAQALELVKRLGLLRRDASGAWILSEPFVSSPPTMDPAVMRAFQKTMIDLAGESLERHPRDLRDITTLTLALDLDDLPEARERLRTLRESLLRLSSESPAPRHVFQLNLQLFPLTRVPEGERQAKRPRRRAAGASLALLLGAGLLHGCGDSGTVAGGNGVETGNYLAVRVTDSVGSPVAGAMVRRIPPSEWAPRVRSGLSPVLDSAPTDASGFARFPKRALGASDRFEAESGSRLGWNEAFGADTFAVRLGGTRWTELSFAGRAPSSVWAARTSLHAAVVAGRFGMRLPADVASPLAGLDSGGIRPVGTASGRGADTVRLAWNPERFLVADFDGDMARTLPGGLAGGGWWYASTDAHLGGSSAFLPLGAERDLALAQAPAESSWAGRSLRLGYRMDTAFSGRFLTTGFLFGNSSDDGRDLSCLDSVVFRARGAGSFGLKLQLPDGLDSLQTAIPFALSDEWRRYSLPVSSFWTGGATPALLSRLVGLQFLATSSGELWLDDLELSGCRIQDVYPLLGP